LVYAGFILRRDLNAQLPGHAYKSKKSTVNVLVIRGKTARYTDLTLKNGVVYGFQTLF
jgi:hypothetical protein